MKKLSVLLLLLLVSIGAVKSNDSVGHTYYNIRPPFQSARPERIGLWRFDAAKENDCGWCGSLQVVPFGGQSTRSKDLAKYFMFCGKSELVVAGDSAFGISLTTNPNLRDVNPAWFGITADNFKSTISFRPKYAFVGAGLMWRQYLGSCCDTAQWWFELSSVIENVRTDMNLKETITQFVPAPGEEANDTVGPSSMTQAFQGNGILGLRESNIGQRYYQWDFGKIDGKRQKTKLGDVELKLGYDFCVCDIAHLEVYVGLVAPIGNRPSGEFVFEPIVGSGHFGVMFGSAFGMDLWCCNDTSIRFELEQNSRYLFKNTEVRSFDAKGKSWSRYMVLRPSLSSILAGGTSSLEPAINVFTQKLNVTPRFAHIINAAFVARTCEWEGEVGINCWARQSEKVSLKNPWIEGVAFASETSVFDPFSATINRAVTIKENFTDADVTVTSQDQYNLLDIKASDLNLASAAHPSALSHTVYGAVGYHWDGCCYPTLVGVGGSYEFSGVNTALNQWMVWCKIGISI